MKLDDEQLKKIEEYASVFMAWQDIATLMTLNVEELRDELGNRKSEVYKAYQRGKTISKYEINKNLVKLAKMGSPQAEDLIRGDIDRQIQSERDL